MSPRRAPLLIRRTWLPALAWILLAGTAAGQLDLPDRRAKPKRPAPRPEQPAPVEPGPAPGEPGSGAPGTPGVEAETPQGRILDRLRGLRDPGDPRVRQAADELLGMGDEGLSAARAALYADHPATAAAGARVLLVAGDDGDRNRVLERLRGKLPAGVAPILLDTLLDSDPTLASPAYLVGLLDHPQTVVRAAAHKALAPRIDGTYLPALTAGLRSDRTDTRLRSLELLAAADDPSVVHLLLDRLGDPSSKVAWRAAQLVARREGIDDALRAAARPEVAGLLERRHAYALLAIAEREDRTGTALLGPDDVPLLLTHLRDSRPLLRGASAVSLAGIGFRSPAPASPAGSGEVPPAGWLDREVPHELVRHVSGEVFHQDFSSLQEPVQRRLALITGRTYKSDGPAWQSWWVEAAEDFRAHRAVLEVRPEELATLLVAYHSGPPEHEVIRFVGPERLDPRTTGPALGRTVYLTRDECSDLVGVLAGQGVFGAERMPGSRAEVGAAARELEVRLGTQGKRFRLPAGSSSGAPTWFDTLATAFGGLDDRNRWQRYPTLGLHATQRDFWLAEHAWWAAPRPRAERDARLKELVFGHLAALRPFERGPGLAELERLAERDALGAEDFPTLRGFVVDELYYSERVRTLVGLCVRAAEDAGRPAGRESGAGELDPRLARELVEALIGSFGDEAAEDLVAILSSSDRELARSSATDERPLLRILAGATLARNPDATDLELLGELLRDPDEDVEATTVLAVAEGGLHDFDTEVALRARIGSPRVRSAALRAVGILENEGAFDLLVAGLAETNPAVKLAAAEGLAELADPESSALLVSLFTTGSDSPLFEPARAGLLALGEAAWPDLRRVAESAASGSRRDAALLLAEQGAPQALPYLLVLLEQDPMDSRVATELAVLSCLDLRGDTDPVSAWRGWYGSVRPDDALAWFRAACELRGLTTPAPEAFTAEDGAGTMEARLFLVDVMGRGEDHLVERARRELNRCLGRDIGKLPARGSLRREVLAELRATLGEER